MVAVWVALCCVTARAEQAGSFETDACGVPSADAPVVVPWRTITLDAEYGGYWVVAGDVDGDGEIEIVSAQNYNRNDDHFTSSVAVQKLDGSVLWRWGDPKLGRRELHHDVACQIHDLDNNGANEVILGGDRRLLVFARRMIVRRGVHPGNPGFRWKPSVHWPCKAQSLSSTGARENRRTPSPSSSTPAIVSSLPICPAGGGLRRFWSKHAMDRSGLILRCRAPALDGQAARRLSNLSSTPSRRF